MYFDFGVSYVQKMLQPFHVHSTPLLNLVGFLSFFLSFFCIKSGSEGTGAEKMARGQVPGN